jgi:hypothetical protein
MLDRNSRPGGAEVANTPRVTVRAESDLIRDVATKHDLPVRASVAEIIRFALAFAAGRPDPHGDALVRPGPKRRAGIIS